MPKYISSYFATGEEGESDLAAIDDHGVENWLSVMAGAIDFTRGEETDTAPQGASDSLLHTVELNGGAGVLRVFANFRLGYVSINLELGENT